MRRARDNKKRREATMRCERERASERERERERGVGRMGDKDECVYLKDKKGMERRSCCGASAVNAKSFFEI